MTPPLEAGGVAHRTLLLSDLVRSTDLIQQLGDERSAALFDRHDRLARDLLPRHGGTEIDKSDGFLLLFEQPINAVLFAMDFHVALLQLSEELHIPITTRIGIHSGEVFLRANRPQDVQRGAKPLEVEGLAKPLAARLMSVALGGQTLLTRSAFDLARQTDVEHGGRASDLIWTEHGPYAVQGLIDPVTVFEVGVSGVAPLRPPPGTRKVRRVEAQERDQLPAIAILPFAILPPDSSDDHLSAGLTDEIIADLSQVAAIRVFARTSAEQLKDTPEALAGLRERHNLRYTLEGTVRKTAEQIRVTAKLFEIANHELLWAGKYGGALEEIFDIQETLSQAVVEALELEVSKEERESMVARPIPNVQAYEYYLKAKAEITRFREDSLEKVLDYLRQGMKIIGEDNILLNSAMGYAQWQYFNSGITADRAYIDKAEACATRILKQAPHSAHGHRLLGLVGMHQKDLQRVVKHLKLALEDDPTDADALFWLPLIYGYVGRPAAGFPLAERLLAIDPLTPFYNCLPGWLLLLQGDFDLATQPLRRAYDMDPGSPLLTFCYGHSLALAGRTAEACDVFGSIIEEMPDNFHAGLVAVFRSALQGDRQATLGCVTAELEEAVRKDLQYSWHMAEYLSLVDERDSALAWLENAIDRGFIGYPLFSKLDPFLENLRGQERFAELMARVRPLWTHFEE